MSFTINNRVLDTFYGKPGKGTTLVAVRDRFATRDRLQEPQDLRIPVQQLHVLFENETMTAQVLTKSGVQEEKFQFLHVGASQLASRVLPSYGFKVLRELAEIDHRGAQLAALTWAKFLEPAKKEAALVRTIRTKVGDGVVRVVRSVHSGDYAPFGNTEFLTQAVENAGAFSQNEVIHYALTDHVFRCRVRGEVRNDLVPVVELWNSEVGQRRVVMRAGLFNTRTEGLIGSWTKLGERSWIHRGNPDRIRQAVETSFKTTFTESERILQAYQEATNFAIDDAAEWFKDMLAARMTTASFEVATNALAGGQVHRLNGDVSVAGMADAVAVAAGKLSDPDAAYDVEQLAGEVLRLALAEAKK